MIEKDRKTPIYFPVILEIGNLIIRAGFANDAVPLSTRQVNDPLFECVLNEPNTNSSSLSSQNLNDISYVSDEYNYNSEKKRIEIDEECEILLQYKYDLTHLKYLFNNNVVIDSYTSGYFELHLYKLLNYIFEYDLLVDPSACKVIIPIQLLCPIHIRKHICNVLLKNIGVQSVSFFPSPLLSVISTGAETGLVVDLNWDSATISPICFNTYLHMKSNIIRKCSGKNIHYQMLRNLKKYILKEENSNTAFSDKFLQDHVFDLIESIINECSYVRSKNLAEDHNLEETIQKNSADLFNYRDILKFPNELRYLIIEDVYFRKKDAEKEELSLIEGILKTINDCDIFVKNKLSCNIIFTGDLSCIPGIKSRILQELRGTDSPLSFFANLSLGNWAGASAFTYNNLIKNRKSFLSYETSKEHYLTSNLLSLDWLDKFFRHIEVKKRDS